MDNKIIELGKSGYTIELRGYLSTKDVRNYTKKMLGLTYGLPDDEKIKAGVVALVEGQEFILEKLIVKLTDKDNNEVDDPYNTLMDMPNDNTKEVFPIVQEIIESSTMSGEVKKNGQKPVSDGSKD